LLAAYLFLAVHLYSSGRTSDPSWASGRAWDQTHERRKIHDFLTFRPGATLAFETKSKGGGLEGLSMRSNHASLGTRVTAALCAALLTPLNVVSSPLPRPQAATSTTPTPSAAKIPNDQLDSLVAPIALYPDPLLAQTLAASTYPLEIIQLQQWMTRHPELKGEALAAAV